MMFDTIMYCIEWLYGLFVLVIMLAVIFMLATREGSGNGNIR